MCETNMIPGPSEFFTAAISARFLCGLKQLSTMSNKEESAESSQPSHKNKIESFERIIAGLPEKIH